MSKILDKIKEFGHSLTSMFQENDQEENVDYLNPDTEEAKKLAAEMQPYVDELNKIEAEREKAQKAEVDRLNHLREGTVDEPVATSKAQRGQVRQSTRLSSMNREIDVNKEQGTDGLEQLDEREGR